VALAAERDQLVEALAERLLFMGVAVEEAVRAQLLPVLAEQELTA
jgi:hypothetical protein